MTTIFINPNSTFTFVLKQFDEHKYGLQLHPTFDGQRITPTDLGFYETRQAARLKAESIMTERWDKGNDEISLYKGDWT